MIVLKKFWKQRTNWGFKILWKLPKPHALAVQEWLDGKIYTEIQLNKSTMSVLSGRKFY
jgi:hypothetical protein